MAGVAWVTLAVVTNPVAFPASADQSRMFFSLPLSMAAVSQAFLCTLPSKPARPKLAFTPAKRALAPAAESVTW